MSDEEVKLKETTEQLVAVVEDVTKEVSEDVAASQIDPTPLKEPYFKDEDVLQFTVNTLNTAMERSRKNNFAVVGFKFAELQLLHKVSKAALERTQKLNYMIDTLRERDLHLALQLGEFRELVQLFANNSNKLATGYNEILNTIRFFVKKVLNEESKSTD